MKNRKPILLVKFPRDADNLFIEQISANLNRKLDEDYYVLCLNSEVNDIEFDLIGIADLKELNFKELKEIISDL